MHSNLFALYIKDDSMIHPNSKHELPLGCTVIIDREKQPKNWDYVAIIDKITNTQKIRRLVINDDRHKYLANNSKYPTLSNDDAFIIGVAISKCFDIESEE